MKNLVVLLFLITFPFPQDDYKSYFKKGMEEMGKNNRKKALKYFSKSYQLQKHSKTCYYMALCYFNFGNYEKAKNYAVEAKHAKPELPINPYMNKIDTIMNYVPISHVNSKSFLKKTIEISSYGVTAPPLMNSDSKVRIEEPPFKLEISKDSI